MWIENHQDHIFFYEDFSDSEPFILGIQTEWQLQQLPNFDNRSVLAADSRFGTNKLKYPFYSLLVFDSNNNAIPVAWILTPNYARGEIHRWMGALYDRVHSKDPTWKLGGFIVDDPSADVVTIREVFQCFVLISFWRVRHAWHKNLMEKCSETESRVEMSRRLGEIVTGICRRNGDIDYFEAFMEDFVDCSGFLDYFKAIWYPRIGMWTTALKALPLASTEVSAAIECYHTQLKLRLLNEEDSSIYQRSDWLVDKLGTKVHSYYWLDEYSGKENFAQYWKDEWKSGLSSWRMASQIPDSDVVMDGKCAKVASSKDREVVHIVLNPGSEFAICSCSWSRIGNLCKHVIKSAKVYRDKGLATASTSLFEYNRILMNILRCPPNDSVIRDHAVALAVSVQSQLSALFGLRSGATNITVPRQQQTDTAETGVASTNLDIPDEDMTSEQHSVSENNTEKWVIESCSITENNYVSGDTDYGNIAHDNPSLDQNNVATHDHSCGILENGHSEGHANSTPIAIRDNSGNENMRDSQMHYSLDCNDTGLDSNDANEKVGINHKMDVTLDKEDSCNDNFMEKRDVSPLSCAAVAVNDASVKALEDATDLMDVEMPSIPVEVHIVRDSSGITKEGLDISPDVPSVINGVA